MAAATPLTPIEIGLTAAIVTVVGDEPLILVAGEAGAGRNEPRGLPFGPFDALTHRTFEIGLRSWVEAQTGLPVGYVEQLYTFGDRGRHVAAGRHRPACRVGRLSRADPHAEGMRRPCARAGASFEPWYRFFPWEDWRDGAPGHARRQVIAAARRNGPAASAPDRPERALGPAERMRLCFGVGGSPWDEEKVLDRYELLYEAGLVEEARRDGARRHG